MDLHSNQLVNTTLANSMKQTTYLLFNEASKLVADIISASTFINSKVRSDNLILDDRLLRELASSCQTEYFYVIITDVVLEFREDAFNFRPRDCDSKYIHIWNNDTGIRLYNKKATLWRTSEYTDASIKLGRASLKNTDSILYTLPKLSPK